MGAKDFSRIPLISWIKLKIFVYSICDVREFNMSELPLLELKCVPALIIA